MLRNVGYPTGWRRAYGFGVVLNFSHVTFGPNVIQKRGNRHKLCDDDDDDDM